MTEPPMVNDETVPTRAVTPVDETRLARDVVAWRRHLHAHPELAFEELETAAYAAERLRSFGPYVVREGVAGTGVVADLPGPAGAPVIALRADMDALSVHETADVSFRSRVPGRMHACGHDGHVAMLLGAAAQLARSELRVGVRLLFQPSEETVGPDGRSGAQAMIGEGALDAVHSAFALHLEPSLPTGTIRLTTGPAMACLEVFRGTVRGAGGHGARPERTTDPVWMLAPILTALESIVSRRVSALDAAVLSIGRIAGGTTPNVIPSEIEIEGTLRTFTTEVRDLLRRELESALSISRTLGGDFDLEVRAENPVLDNDPAACAVVTEAIARLWPDMKVLAGPYGLLSEDFGFIAQEVPAALAMIGCAPPTGPVELHSPDFDLDERALMHGVELLSAIVRVASDRLTSGTSRSGSRSRDLPTTPTVRHLTLGVPGPSDDTHEERRSTC
jgi:amidohydrolase